MNRRILITLDTGQTTTAAKQAKEAVLGLERGMYAAEVAAARMKAAGEALARQAAPIISGYRQQNQALLENIRALKLGPAAVIALSNARERETALANAGVTAESRLGQAILAQVNANQRLTVQANQLAAAHQQQAQGANQATSASSSLRSVLQTLVPAATLAGIVALGTAAVKMSLDVSTTLTQITTLAGVSRQQVGAWGKDFDRIGIEAAKGPAELVHAMYLITGAGQRGADAIKILESSAKASAIGLGETGVIAKAVAAELNAYAKDGLTAAHATDILVATVREGNTEADALAPVLGRVAGLAQRLGVSFQETGAFVATFTRLGVDADEAVTSLRGTLNALLTPEKAQREALASVGLSMAQLKQEIREKGLTEALGHLTQLFHGNDDAMGALFPNIRALAGVLGTAGAQSEEFVRVMENIKASIGHATEEAFKMRQADPSFIFEQMKVAGQQLLKVFGDAVVPALQEISRELKDGLTGSLKDAAKELGSITGSGLRIFAEALVTVANNINLVRAATISYLALKMLETLTSWSRGVGILGMSLDLLRAKQYALIASNFMTWLVGLLNPITAIAIGVGALGYAFYALKQDQDRAEQSQRDLAKAMDEADPIHRQNRDLVNDTTKSLLLMAIASRKVLEAEIERRQEALQAARESASGSSGIESSRNPGANARLRAETIAQGAALDAIKKKYEENRKAIEDLRKVQVFEAGNRNDEALATANAGKKLDAHTDSANANAEAVKAAAAAAKKLRETMEEARAAAERSKEALVLLGQGVPTDHINALVKAAEQLKKSNLADPLVKALAVMIEAKEAADDLRAGLDKLVKIRLDGLATIISRADIKAQFAAINKGADVDDQKKLNAELERGNQLVQENLTAEEKKNQAIAEAVNLYRAGRIDQETYRRILRANVDLIQQAAAATATWMQTLADSAQPAFDALSAWTDQAKNDLVDLVVSGSDSWEQLAESFEKTMLRAIIDVLIKFVAAEHIKQAEAARTAAIQSSSLGMGGGGGGFQGAGFGSLASLEGGGGVAGGGVVGGSGGGVMGFMGGGSAGAALAWVGVIAAVFAIFTHYMETHTAKNADSRVEAAGGRYVAPAVAGHDHNYRAAQAAAQGVADEMNSFLDQFQAFVVSSTAAGVINLRKKNQGKKTDWVVYANGIATHFGQDMQAAMDYAAVQGLKQSDLAGLSPELQTAIRNSAAKTMDQMQQDMAHALFALQARIGSTGTQLVGISDHYGQEITAARRLGLATDQLVAARKREEEALKNQLLGIDTASADHLAALRSYQAGIEEERARVQAALDAAQADLLTKIPKGGGLRRSEDGATDFAGEVDENARLLQEAVQRYVDQLAELPKKLTDQEVGMGIFDTLYQYLEGSAKYEKQRAAYAKIKVELEFAAIKAQLIALGRWEEFAGMFSDAYAAALAAAGKKPSAGGGGKGQARDDFAEQLRTLRNATMNDAARGLAELNKQLEEFRKAAAAAHATAADRAEGERLLREAYGRTLREAIAPYLSAFGKTDFEQQLAAARKSVADERAIPAGQRRLAGGPANWELNQADANITAAFKKQLDDAIAGFLGLSGSLQAVHDQADVLRTNVVALGLDADETAKRLAAIGLGEAFQIQQGQLGVMDRLFGYLKGSAKYAEQVKENEKKKLELDFLVIEAQLKAWNLWTEATQAIFNDAHQAAVDALGAAGSDADRQASFQDAIAQRQADAAAAQQEAVRRFASAIDKLIDVQRSLRLDDQLSYLNPRQQVDEARQRLAALEAQARAGNVDAMEQLAQAIPEYLHEYLDAFGRTGGFLAESQRLDDLITFLRSLGGTFSNGNVIYGGGFGGAGGGALPVQNPLLPGTGTGGGASGGSTGTGALGGGAGATEATLQQIGRDVARFGQLAVGSSGATNAELRDILDALQQMIGRLNLFLSRTAA